MSESALLDKIQNKLAELKRAGLRIKWVKYHGSQFTKANTPDLHITFDGRSYWIELKKLGEKPTPGQEFEMAEWRAAGAVSECIDTVEKLMRVLKCK